MQRDGAGRARQPVHLGGIVDALEDRARAPGLGEDAEARAGVAVPPRGRLDHERAERAFDAVDIDAARAQPSRQLVVFVARGHVVVLS